MSWCVAIHRSEPTAANSPGRNVRRDEQCPLLGHESDLPCLWEAVGRWLLSVRPLYPQIDSYRFYFTGVPLELAAGTRRSAEWTRLRAGDESSVVLACKLVNRMQTDLTEGEFEMLVKALARRFDGEPFDEAAFPPEPSSERGVARQPARSSRVDWAPASLQRRARYRFARDARVLGGSDVAPAFMGNEHSAGRSAALPLLARGGSGAGGTQGRISWRVARALGRGDA